jgi:hypothetical protein
MPTPKKVIVDCSTGISTEVELTAEEIADQKAMEIEFAKRKAKEEADAETKAELKASGLAKLTALGLTEDEAKAIIG